jgi:hypothetical protein
MVVRNLFCRKQLKVAAERALFCLQIDTSGRQSMGRVHLYFYTNQGNHNLLSSAVGLGGWQRKNVKDALQVTGQ